ncbi:transporter [Actinobaculum sp. 313]|nr:transporter [Actinobaculum sp. 313]
MADSKAVAEALSTLPGISLEELSETAELLQRVDRKYLVPRDSAAYLVADLAELGARALTIEDRREFSYLSMYFDTPTFGLYREAATGRRRRFKVRERMYLDSGLHFLELKTRGPRSLNVKDRRRLKPVEIRHSLGMRQTAGEQGDVKRGALDDGDTRIWLAEMLLRRGIEHAPIPAQAGVDSLLPVLNSAYRRSTILQPDLARLTIDRDLTLAPCLETGSIGKWTRSSSKRNPVEHHRWRIGSCGTTVCGRYASQSTRSAWRPPFRTCRTTGGTAP